MADEIMTFDEILADPIYKAEFDRRITKALSTVQAKLDAEVEKNKKYEEKGTGETVETIKKQLSELQEKYDKDTGDYKAQISDRDYDDAMKKAVADKGIKFSSKAAERPILPTSKKNILSLKMACLMALKSGIRRRPKPIRPRFRPASPRQALQSLSVPAAHLQAKARVQCSQNNSMRSMRRLQRRSEFNVCLL